MLVNKTIGRQQSASWILGRASRTHSAQTGRDVPLFETLIGDYERNASLLSSPPEIWILTDGEPDDQAVADDQAPMMARLTCKVSSSLTTVMFRFV